MNIARTAGKMNARASRLRIIGLFLIVFAFALFVYFTSRQQQHIDTQQNQIVEKDAVIDEKSVALEKVAVADTRRDNLTAIVTEYLVYRERHDVGGLNTLYADRLDRYMKNLRDCSKADVADSDQKYWKDFPKDSFTVAGSPVITINEDRTAKVIIIGSNCRTPGKCVDQALELHFNTENKIDSVRGFIQGS